MPVCCAPTEVEFINASSTSIAYDAAMRAKYGVQPRVFVYYYDSVSGEFYLSPFFTVMKFDGSTITVDHGGPNTGIVVVK
jgi:hypothetical protein